MHRHVTSGSHRKPRAVSNFRGDRRRFSRSAFQDGLPVPVERGGIRL